MGKSGFDLMRSSGDREHSFTHVDISSACSDQLQGTIDAYSKIAEKLEEIDRMHKEKFSDKLLTDIFHSAMGYLFEKISQGIHSQSYGDRNFGHVQVGALKKTYKKFEAALLERNEFNEFIEYDLNEYFHAIDRLDHYLSGSDASMEEVDARIYLSYLRHEHGRFVQIAKEIDEEYETQT
jgi:hypothetical protein